MKVFYNGRLSEPKKVAPHCENCGDENPETDDGYTTCCNEPICDGYTPHCQKCFPEKEEN